MKLKCLFVLMASLIALPVLAASYAYSGPQFNSFVNFTTCSVGKCTNYASSMHITGVFSTAAPLAPNLTKSNIGALVTSYSLNDGVNTIASSDPNARLNLASVSTNATGAITSAFFRVDQWTSGTNGAHAAGNRFNYIVSSNTAPVDAGVSNAICTVVSADVCMGISTDASTSYGSVGAQALWILQPSFVSTLENPQAASFQSGIGLISGWSCQGPQIGVAFDGTTPVTVPYGSSRGDTASVCGAGNINTGFGLLLNYNLLGGGTHTAQLFVNGQAQGSPVHFTVTVPAGEFLNGASQQVTVTNFPESGKTTVLIWQQSQQNFAIMSVSP